MAQAQYTSQGGVGVVASVQAAAAPYSYGHYYYYVQPVNDAVLQRVVELDIPASSLVRGVRVHLTAKAPGNVRLDTVAEVRSAGAGTATSSAEIVVDFKGLRTISAIGSVATVSRSSVTYSTWSGTAFTNNIFSPTLSDFSETATERIRFNFPDPVSVADVGSEWTATLPTPPQTVDLLVNGGRVWSGGVATPAEPDSEFDVDAEIDLTQAVAAAVAATVRPVRIELIASSPAVLDLDIVDEDVLHAHDVGFPEGATRRVVRDDEGPWTLDLPLDLTASAHPHPDKAEVRRVEWTLRAETDDVRRRPAEGPAPSNDASLLLDLDRSILAQLPPVTLSPYATLTGVRLLLAADAEAEVTCELLAGTESDDPGEVLEGGVFEPVLVESTNGSFVWHTVRLSEELSLDDHAALWIAVRLVRGEASWAATAANPESVDRALLRWRAPSGTYRSLSAPIGLDELDATVRVVGVPHAETPVPSFGTRLSARPLDDPAEANPPATGQRFVIDLGTEYVTPTDHGSGQAPTVDLDVVTSTPGAFTIEGARIFYSPPASAISED